MAGFKYDPACAGLTSANRAPKFSLIVPAWLLTSLVGANALWAQTVPAGDTGAASISLDPVVVTATRTPTTVSQVPGSVSVITREEIDEQAAISDDLGDILSKTVPGFSPSTETVSNFGQTLRGRSIQVLIDGIPISTPLRSISRDLRTIAPEAIERIEVIRGATAIYGFGATGGIVNIITRRAGEGEPTFSTRLESNIALTHPDDSIGYGLTQTAGGELGKFDYALVGGYENTGDYFDANGDSIDPNPLGQGGLAEAEVIDVLGKLGYDFGDQRLEFTSNYYENLQDLGELSPDRESGTENLVAGLSYTNGDVLGSSLDTQVYYQDYESAFALSTFTGSQSFLDTEKYGARVALDTPIPMLNNAGLTWGLDYLRDKTAQRLTDGRDYVPPIEQDGYALFSQLEVPFGERLLLRGGARYEQINLDIGDFQTIAEENDDGMPGDVEGGELDFDEILFNVGLVYFVTDYSEVFTSFSQGFSVADIGRELRGTDAASVAALNPKAQVVDNYEIGLRTGRSRWDASLAFFFNESDLGTTFGDFPQLEIQRRKEEIYGAELTLDWRAADQLSLGGTYTWYEGKFDTDENGSLDRYLPGDRISPPKVTAYADYRISPGWDVRLQALYVHDRSRFGPSGEFGEGEIDDFTIVDLVTRVELGPGALQIAIENVLNKDYEVLESQSENLQESGFLQRGRGANLTVSYGIRY